MIKRQSQTTKLTLFILGVLLLVSIDFFIKSWVESNWVRGWDSDTVLNNNEQIVRFANDPNNEILLVHEIKVIEDFWSFIYVRNYNIGFSLFRFIEDLLSPSAQVWFFKIIQLIGILIIALYFFYRRLVFMPVFVLIIGGGLGNVVDRWYRGYVVDYVKWYIPNSPIDLFNPWPIFNLADSFVSIGAVILIIILFFFPRRFFQDSPSSQ